METTNTTITCWGCDAEILPQERCPECGVITEPNKKTIACDGCFRRVTLTDERVCPECGAAQKIPQDATEPISSEPISSEPISFNVTKAMLAVTAFEPKDETRGTVCGTRFEEHKGNLRMVVTDGFVLSVLDTHRSVDPFEPFAIDTTVLKDMLKGRQDDMGASVEVQKEHVVLRRNGVQAQISKIEKDFPTYHRVIPEVFDWAPLTVEDRQRVTDEPETVIDPSNYRIAFDVEFMIKIGQAVKKLGVTPKPVVSLKIHDERSAMLFEAKSDSGTMRIVLMPMRWGG